MNTWRLVCCAATALMGVGLSAPAARADFHFWDIKEIYSNHDGSVQFIEFFTAAAGQEVLGVHNIAATSTVAGTPTIRQFNFPSNLSLLPPNPSTTANKHMLIATAGFGGLTGGVTPDFTLPEGSGPFFDPNADSISINFAHNTDIVSFVGTLLPKDGVSSLTDQSPAGAQNLVAGVNSPTNFQSAAGSVNLPPPGGLSGNFNETGPVDGADLALWKTGYGTIGSATHGQGDADGDSDVDGRDFLIWQRQSGQTGVSAVPEPGGGVLLALAAGAAAICLAAARESRRLQLARDCCVVDGE